MALSAIAFKTDSLRIGPMITPLSWRRVQKVARETVTLDHLSSGRLTLDVGLGNPDDHRPYGPWPKPSPSPYVAEWHDSGERGDPSNPYGPREIATIYRALRKGREDNKDEPGAADFYYGEMEMRRHDPTKPRAERLVLLLYWLTSGYALRASWAVAWLAGVLILATFLLAAYGLEQPTTVSAVQATITGSPPNPDHSLPNTDGRPDYSIVSRPTGHRSLGRCGRSRLPFLGAATHLI